MIDTILAREKEYKDDYYVFVSIVPIMRGVFHKISTTRLYFHFKRLPAELLKSFIFLRFEDVSGGPSNVQNFLIV